jgi:hypothetical protein
LALIRISAEIVCKLEFMKSLFSAKSAPAWPLAVALSLLLHASVLLPWLFFSPGSSSSGNAEALAIDTRAPPLVAAIRLLPPAPRQTNLAGTSGLHLEAQSVAASAAAPTPVEQEPIVLATPTVPQPRTGEPPPGMMGNGAREEGQGATGDRTAVFFQIATRAKAIVYVVDRSASMGLNGYLAAAKRELLTSLAHLPESARFQIIVYNRTARTLRIHANSGLVLATSENKRCAAALLEGIPAEGGTEHVQALREALALGPEVIFFLTDAADLRAEQIRAITSLNRGRCIIHAVELGRAFAGSGDPPLYALAQENQGCYKCVGPSFSGAP